MDVTMTDIEAMNATLRSMQEETEKLSRVIHRLLQAGTIMERLVRVSGNLGTPASADRTARRLLANL